MVAPYWVFISDVRVSRNWCHTKQIHQPEHAGISETVNTHEIGIPNQDHEQLNGAVM